MQMGSATYEESGAGTSTKEVEGDGKQEESCLIFLGTFYHDNHDEHNVDLIQFKEPVRLLAIRVIPLGATVNLSNGSSQLGATNPSELELEFYYNDLQDPTKSTFSMMEKFQYQEKQSINFSCESFESEIFTDGILVRGLYSSLTLATYGYQVSRDKIKITSVPETVAEEKATGEENVFPELDKEVAVSDLGAAGTNEVAKAVESSEAAGVTRKDGSEQLEIPVEIVKYESVSGDKLESGESPQAIPTITTRFNTSPIKSQRPKFESVILNEEKIERVSSEEEQFDDIGQEVDAGDRGSGSETTKPAVALAPIIVPIEAEDISDEEIICDDEDEHEGVSESGSRDFSKHNKSAESVSSSVKDDVKSSHEEHAADISQDMSDQDGSFGEDLSEFVEQISDAELDDYSDDDTGIWEDISFETLVVEYNPLSPSFKIRPLKKISIESFVARPAKADKAIWNQVIHNLRKYSEDSFKEALLELWVETVEQTLPMLPAALDYIESNACDCVQILSFWVKLGLDLNLAKSHRGPPFIVRHLKAGLKLAELLSYHGGSYLDTLFQNHISLLESLFEILDDEMLKTSLIQRLICKVLERVLDFRRGWDEFMSSKAEGLAFDKLERFLEKNVEPRCAMITKNLLTKVTLTFRSVAINELAMGIAAGMKVSEKQWIQFHMGMDDLRLLTIEFFRKHKTVLEQLGARNFSDSSSTVGTFRVLQEFEFMKSLATILYCADFDIDRSVVICIVEILRQISSSEIGLVYLCAEGETTRRVIKKLYSVARCNNLPDTISVLGLLCLEVQVMIEIDNLLEAPPWTFEESEEDNNSLQRLHSLLSSDVGRDALVRVVTMGGQIRNLLRIIKDDYSDDNELQIISLCRRGYATPLLYFIIKFSDNSEFIKRFGQEMHDTISTLGEDVEGIEKLKELLPFLKLSLDSNNFTFGGIDGLSTMLESLTTESFLVGSQVPATNYGFTPEIITILRIFNDMAHSDEDYCGEPTKGTSSTKELEWLQNGVELNSKDVASTCVKLLKKISFEFDQQGFLSARLVGLRGDIFLSCVFNIVKLLRKILTLVIENRKFDFHEVEPVEALIDLYGILKHFPPSSKSLRKVSACASCLVETIGLFAIPLPNLKTDEESEDQLKKCMWTRTVSAILKFILKSPSNALSGLDLLLELLPDSSPIISDVPLSSDSIQSLTVNHRRWGVYVHGVTEEIQEVIGTYCFTAEINVLRKLRLFCLTVTNLSPSSCLMICRATIDKVLQSLETDCEDTKIEVPPPSDRRVIYCSTESANCLRFLSSLARWNSKIKAGIMHIGRASSKLDEKYAQFIGLLCGVLTSFAPESRRTTSHVQAQEWVVSLFHSLCDVNNNIFGVGVGSKSERNFSSESIFANSLPTKESLSAIASALISILNFDQISSDASKKLAQGLFSTLQVLMLTDYGFHHLKSALLNHSSQVHDYLEKLVNACATARIEDVVMNQTFAFMNFLHSMIDTKDLKVFPNSRQNALRSFELRKCFIWSGNGDTHLLQQLRQHLEIMLSQGIKADVDTVSLCLAMEQLGRILTCIRTDEVEYIVKSEVSLPPPEPLENIFAICHQRGRDGEVVPSDEESFQPALVEVDLVDLSHGVFSVDLTQLNAFYKIKDLGEVAGGRNADNLSNVKVAPLEDLHNFKSPGLTVGRRPTGFHHSHRGNMRGAYNRSSGHSSGGSHFDRFRSRPPNTSRPPSLHVDDFVAMESSSGANSGRMGARSTSSNHDPYSGRGRGPRGSNRSYDSDRPFRNNSQANSPYFGREAAPSRGSGRGSRGRGWGSADTRSSPARGNYGGRQDQSGGMGNYGRNDDSYRSTRSGSTGVSSSGGGGPIRNTHRYTRQYREAPPASTRSSSSSSSSWRDKPRSSYR